mmetsp:Transcript_7506/g.18111  ORF Transcript_7506/g.18111 Transcript_7506/m.18111 type:complete len:200 (+) Transcript_7506:59-658(+)
MRPETLSSPPKSFWVSFFSARGCSGNQSSRLPVCMTARSGTSACPRKSLAPTRSWSNTSNARNRASDPPPPSWSCSGSAGMRSERTSSHTGFSVLLITLLLMLFWPGNERVTKGSEVPPQSAACNSFASTIPTDRTLSRGRGVSSESGFVNFRTRNRTSPVTGTPSPSTPSRGTHLSTRPASESASTSVSSRLDGSGMS